MVQTKAQRLGMYLMGQAFFSAQLMKVFGPRSIESVALVAHDDNVLRPLFEQYPGMRVVICPSEVCGLAVEAKALNNRLKKIVAPDGAGHDGFSESKVPSARPAGEL